MPLRSPKANRPTTGNDGSGGAASEQKKKPGKSKFALRQLSARHLKSLGFLYSGLVFLSPRVIFASIIINIFGLAIPIAILQVYDRIIPNEALSTLYIMCGGLVGIVVLETLLRIARSYVVGLNASKFGHHTSLSALRNIISANDGDV